MLQNKRFQNNNDPQDVVTIINDSGVFYSLSNGANIKKDIFFQKYSEMVDATNFFQQQTAAGLAQIVEQARTMNPANAIDGKIEPSVKVLQPAISEQGTIPPEYKEMYLKNFERERSQNDLSQYKVYENDEEAAADFERKMKQQQQSQQRPRPQFQEPTQAPIETVMESTNTPISNQPAYVSPEEEAFRFFRSFKKVYPIKLNVDFDEKIAEPAFIKLMAVNYEGDIIKFYTKEFMNRIYNDPGFLENKIYEKLRSIVFEEDKPVKKPRTPKKLTEGNEKGNQKDIKTPKPDKKPKPMKNG